MAIVRDRTKLDRHIDDNCPANADLTAYQYHFVEMGGGATGAMTVDIPTGQGQLCYGVLMNTPDVGEEADIACEGFCEVIANAALNAGIEITTGTAGHAEAAGSNDIVMGFTREAASAAGHLVAIRLVSPYIKA